MVTVNMLRWSVQRNVKVSVTLGTQSYVTFGDSRATTTTLATTHYIRCNLPYCVCVNLDSLFCPHTEEEEPFFPREIRPPPPTYPPSRNQQQATRPNKRKGENGDNSALPRRPRPACRAPGPGHLGRRLLRPPPATTTTHPPRRPALLFVLLVVKTRLARHGARRVAEPRGHPTIVRGQSCRYVDFILCPLVARGGKKHTSPMLLRGFSLREGGWWRLS